MAHFNLPECEDEDAARQLSQSQAVDSKEDGQTVPDVEEKLWKKYLKTKKVSVFEGYLAKQANHW
jgi:hypothetical protein